MTDITSPIIINQTSVVAPVSITGATVVTAPVGIGMAGSKGDKGDTGLQGPQGEPGDPATNLVTSVCGKQGVVTLTAADVNAAGIAFAIAMGAAL